jgi:anti-sigma B factor antagonist
MDELETSEAHLVIDVSSDSSPAQKITLSGELDISNADAFRSKVEEVVAANPPRLIFDLTELTFMDSSGIAVMVYAANNIDSIELQNPSEIIRRVVEATGLTEILRIGSP